MDAWKCAMRGQECRRHGWAPGVPYGGEQEFQPLETPRDQVSKGWNSGAISHRGSGGEQRGCRWTVRLPASTLRSGPVEFFDWQMMGLLMHVRLHMCAAGLLVAAGAAAAEATAVKSIESAGRENEEALRAGTVQRLELPGRISLEMVWIPATTSAEWKRISGGSSTVALGSPMGEAGRGPDEARRAVVISNGFWMSRYEITQEQWMTVMGTNPARCVEAGIKAPVDSVSWVDCRKFIERLDLLIPGAGFRLPYEDEWEYACRAGTTGVNWWGSSPDTVYDYANVENKRERRAGIEKGPWMPGGLPMVSTVPVGSFPPNPWGLYDMTGNLPEWCEDWYAPLGERRSGAWNYYEPTKVVRGGGWSSHPDEARAAVRGKCTPDTDSQVGLRVVRNGRQTNGPPTIVELDVRGTSQKERVRGEPPSPQPVSGPVQPAGGPP